MNSTKKRLTSVFITLSVLIILIFSGPASAITLSIVRTDGSSNPYERDSVSFTGKVDLHTNDVIPIKTIDIIIDSTPNDDLSDATVCSFTLNGTPLANNSATLCDITITNITENYNNLGYGYGYGHGYGYNSSNTTPATRDFTFGYGNNYGYQSGFGYDTYNENVMTTSEVLVDFKWNTPTVSSDKSYKVTLGVHAGTSHPTEFLSKTSVTFTVLNRRASSSTSEGSSTTNTSETTTSHGIDFQIKLQNPEVDSIVLNLGKKLNSVMVEVHEALSGNIVVSAGHKVFKYLKVDLENSAEENLNYATIHFKVPKSWLKENGLVKEDIVMKRLTGTSWNELDTKYTGQDSVYYYYEAKTPGFSYFAIGVKSSQETTPTITPTPPQPPKTPTEVIVQKGCAQVITHAIDPNTGKCVDFATPCDVPKTWNIVDKCKAEFTKSGQKIEPEVKTGGLTPREVSVILLTLIVVVLISWIIYRASNPRNPIDRYRRRKKYHYKKH